MARAKDKPVPPSVLKIVELSIPETLVEFYNHIGSIMDADQVPVDAKVHYGFGHTLSIQWRENL